MTVMQIMEVGREPTWIAIFNPIGGAIAVLIGGLVLAGSVRPRTADDRVGEPMPERAGR